MLNGPERAFLSAVGGRLLGNPPTLEATLHLCTSACLNLPYGDFVECGVYAGCHPAVMAYVAERQDKERKGRLIHLFDSFAGIPHAGPRDDETITGCIGPNKDGKLISSGVSVCTVEQVAAHMLEWGVDPARLRYHIGWFQDTVKLAAAGELKANMIAVLRLDGDLFESTKVCLEHLYPLVLSGGYVIIDDYALTGCRAAVHEYFGDKLPRMEPIPGGGGPVWFRKP